MSLRETFDTNQLIGEPGTSPSLELNNSDNIGSVISIDSSSITTRVFTNPRNYELSPFSFNNLMGGLNEGSLTFIEMKIENKDNCVVVHMVYIDKETYEEVTRSFKCYLSASKEYRLRNFSTRSDLGNLTLELKDISSIEETRKQL